MSSFGNSGFLVASIVVLAIALLLSSDVFLLQTQARQSRDLQTVKSQLDQSNSGLVNFPVADYRLAVVFSFVALVIGAAGGFWLGRRKASGWKSADEFGQVLKKRKTPGGRTHD